MPKPYDQDLREMLLAASDRRELMQEDLARLFGGILSFVRSVIRRREQTGSTRPKPHAGGLDLALGPMHLEWLLEEIACTPDAKQQELAQRLVERRAPRISRQVTGRAVKKLGLTRKKKSKAAEEQKRPDEQE